MWKFNEGKAVAVVLSAIVVLLLLGASMAWQGHTSKLGSYRDDNTKGLVYSHTNAPGKIVLLVWRRWINLSDKNIVSIRDALRKSGWQEILQVPVGTDEANLCRIEVNPSESAIGAYSYVSECNQFGRRLPAIGVGVVLYELEVFSGLSKELPLTKNSRKISM